MPIQDKPILPLCPYKDKTISPLCPYKDKTILPLCPYKINQSYPYAHTKIKLSHPYAHTRIKLYNPYAHTRIKLSYLYIHYLFCIFISDYCHLGLFGSERSDIRCNSTVRFSMMLLGMIFTIHIHLPLIYLVHCLCCRRKAAKPGPTQTVLYSHRRWLEAGNFIL